MQATIKSISLENFKGTKSASYAFDGRSASVTGCNGAGKSTIADAFYWTFGNCDYGLHNNPSIFPLGIEECTPTVRINLDFDGKSVEVDKIQKRTVKKSKTGGADTISLSNSYEVNGVECGERDFKKKMQSYGFDFDLFLPLSHPDVFTGQKAVDMRKVLFGMASEKSDKEIAELTEGAEIVANLLSEYNADEVRAMQNATLRKIREAYGKDGEILRAEIRGKESDKTDINVSELESQRDALDRQIAENREKQEDISKQFDKLKNEAIQLESKLANIQIEANKDLRKKRSDMSFRISVLMEEKSKVSREIYLVKQKIPESEELIKNKESKMDKCVSEWTSLNEQLQDAQNREFNENDKFCRHCGQELPEDKKAERRSNFEKAKEKEIKRIRDEMDAANERGAKEKAAIKELESEMQKLKEVLKQIQGEETRLGKEIETAENKLESLPEYVDISGCEDVKEIQNQMAEKETALQQDNSADAIRQQLKAEEETLQKQMDAVNGEFALVKKNVEIDGEIADLRKKQRQFEQQKADVERIIDQLDMISMKKNEMLADEINSHFRLVKFRLFTYLKNGTVVDDCEPTIDGKTLSEHSNGALKVLAKLDIIDGLQRYYQRFYPVFADDFSLVTGNTESRINLDSQLIKLKAVEGIKELRIEVE